MVVFRTQHGNVRAFDREQEVIYRTTNGIPDIDSKVSSDWTNEEFNSRVRQGRWIVIKDDSKEEFFRVSKGYEI